MKTIFYMLTVVLPICVMSDQAHFIAVDENGHPVSGVQVFMTWSVWKDGDIVDVAHKIYTSDVVGKIVTERDFPRWARLKDISKDGYVVEPYLNLHRRGPYFPATREQPFRFVLRKRHVEQAVTIWHPQSRYERKVVARGERGTPLPLWIVGHADGIGHMEADCFALPSFDEVSKEWTCTFWTTNVLGGVIATTNRVYVAPEDGYQQRIEVPLRMCSSPTFTLFVKGYAPKLYAMFWIHGWGADKKPESDCWKYKSEAERYAMAACPDAGKRYAALEVTDCRYNPFGDRILEVDDDLCATLDDEYLKWVLRALEQHSYPPKPNRLARLANAAKRKALSKEIHDLREILWKNRNERKEFSGKQPLTRQKTGTLELADEPIHQKIRALVKELFRLEKEAPTLNLPSEGDGKK